ncbi:DUF3017 domain-containing protein [Bifidobacterium sp. 82T24]|uniref:DUF3017 domain-containing protein n=1 Tax=Bifidobacterium pluvialisilvae TaxID=2834436 RepID=UPI001C56C194|nr:DUF3017 domain-containing protein [Bifidobacterium pluvialisilvae]MBW3088124.1 DUF3017 domain-containing protein [Bifidobacterium pluvialisilvae]
MRIRKRNEPKAPEPPHVSEAHEGKPAYEWGVAACVALSAILAVCGQIFWATIVIAVASIVSATVRLLLHERSPWKIRSIGFDCFFGFALGIGLLATYASIMLL